MAQKQREQIQAFVEALVEEQGREILTTQRVTALLSADDLDDAVRIASMMGIPGAGNVAMNVEGGPEALGRQPAGAKAGPADIKPEVGTEPDGEVQDSTALTPEEIARQEFAGLFGLGDEPGEDAVLLPAGMDPISHAMRIGSPEYGQGVFGYSRGDQYRLRGLPLLTQPVIYKKGDNVAIWGSMSPTRKKYWIQEMDEAGLLDEETPGGIHDQMAAYEEVLAVSTYLGVTPELAVRQMQESKKAKDASETGRLPFSVPASLRTIPDYPSLSQQAKGLMRQAMGRDPEDWEMIMLADELTAQHKISNERQIEAARASYDNTARGVDQAIAVPDPTLRAQAFLEDTWQNEIARQEDVAESTETNQAMISAITRGAQMVGG